MRNMTIASTAAVILFAVGLSVLLMPTPLAAAAEVLDAAAQRLKSIQTMHVVLDVRTLPADNPELVGPKYDFHLMKIWKQFGDSPSWRLEKPGRTVVMSEGQVTGWIPHAKYAYRVPFRSRGHSWLDRLLDPATLLEQEVQEAQRKSSTLRLEPATTADGHEQLVLTVDAAAEGDYSKSDHARNRSVIESDHRRVYRFNRETLLLESLEIHVKTADAAVPVIVTRLIEYDTTIDPQRFVLEIPDDAVWHQAGVRRELPPDYPAEPRAFAEAVFKALAEKDWDRYALYASSGVAPLVKQIYGGLEVLEIGQPFKSGLYPGWFVPYKVRLPEGRVKQWNLAVRNDTPDGGLIIDGGL